MLNYLLIWLALLAGLVLLVVDKRRGIGALTLAYFLALSLGHVPGALAYLNPDFWNDPEYTRVGFDVTLNGMIAFIVGAMAARMLLPPKTSVKAYQQTVSVEEFSRLGWRVVTLGAACYFVLMPVSALVPSFTSITASLGTLLILGFYFQLYAAAGVNDRRRIFLILAMLPLLPLATLTTGGFIGFGTIWALGVVSFLFVLLRRRIWFYVSAPMVVFLGLSLFVTYYQQRGEIRGVVWNENTGIMQRLEKVSSLVTDFQLFDMSNEKHLTALDDRLNQNYLVGVGVIRYREGETELLYGASVPYWALIPRAIWPDKPGVGGGGDLVAKFTGFDFAAGTSVGAGQVLEFYANFAMPGVLIGFGVFGFILMRIDQWAMRAFAMRDVNGVLRTVLPGFALVQPLGNLLEILVAVVAAIIASHLLIRSKLLRSRSTQRRSLKTSEQRMRVTVQR
jgi:hypothetical protein